MIGLALLPVGLVMLLSVLLYVPSVQDAAIRQAARLTSEATGMDISIGQIRLSFPLHLKIQRVQVVDRADTLLRLDRLSLRIRPLPLFRQLQHTLLRTVLRYKHVHLHLLHLKYE